MLFTKLSPNQYAAPHKLTQNQIDYLVSGPITAIRASLSSNNSYYNILPGDTGQGKTTTLIYHTVPEVIRETGVTNVIYLSPEGQLTGSEAKRAKKLMHGFTLDGYMFNVLEKAELDSHVKKITNPLPKHMINFMFMTNQYLLEHQAKFASGGHLQGKYIVILDEPHKHIGSVSHQDLYEVMGINNPLAKFATFNVLEQLRTTGSLFICPTATPTISHMGYTVAGKKVFKLLPELPRDWTTSNFVNYIPISVVNKYDYYDYDLILDHGFEEFTRFVSEVRQMHSSIEPRTWTIVNTTNGSLFTDIMPDMVIKVSPKGATNGADREYSVEDVEKYCFRNKYIPVNLIGTELLYDGKNEYNGIKIKKAEDITEIINLPQNQTKVHVLMVVERFSVGANIPTLTHAIVARSPSQDRAHNNWSQFLGRLTRLPFFRNHLEARDFVRNLDVSYDQKLTLLKYYGFMSSTNMYVPAESEILSAEGGVYGDTSITSVRDFRTKLTKTLAEGLDFLLEDLNNFCIGSQKMGYKLGKLSQDQSNYIKEKFCSGCPRDEYGLPKCLPNVYEAYNKTYEYITLEKFLSNTGKSTSCREHKDNDHFNNDPNNVAYVCPTLAAIKTDIHHDWNQRYVVINGKKVPIKINNFDV
jgi:hypothetical protein